MSSDHNVITSKIELWEKTPSLIPNLQGHRERVLHPASKSLKIHAIHTWWISDISAVHQSRTPHKEPWGDSQAAAACKGLCRIARSISSFWRQGRNDLPCSTLKLGTLTPQHGKTPLIRVLPCHVSVTSSSGVTFLSATLGGFMSFCRWKM